MSTRPWLQFTAIGSSLAFALLPALASENDYVTKHLTQYEHRSGDLNARDLQYLAANNLSIDDLSAAQRAGLHGVINDPRLAHLRRDSVAEYLSLVAAQNLACSLDNTVPACQSAASPKSPAGQSRVATAEDAAQLGTTWVEQEAGGWTSVWTRRGKSNVFDAVFTDPNDQHKETTVNAVTLSGNQVSVRRKESSNGDRCTYSGTLDGKSISGSRTCANGTAPFHATIE